MNLWFRFYTEALDDPKVQRLPAGIFKGWVNLLCLASKSQGKLPSLEDIAFALRMEPQEADFLVQALITAGLLDNAPDGLCPHNWDKRQFKSDQGDQTAAERMRRYRERQSVTVTRNARNGDGHVTVPRSDTEQNRTDARAREGVIFVLKGSKGWDAWSKVKPRLCVSYHEGNAGQWLPSEFPPAKEQAA